MSTATNQPTIVFPDGYDARREFETQSRGYLGGVVVQLADGSRYEIFFSDLVRLEQNLMDDVRSGRAYYTEPGLVILPEITTEAIKTAVAGLMRDGFFKHLKPINSPN